MTTAEWLAYLDEDQLEKPHHDFFVLHKDNISELKVHLATLQARVKELQRVIKLHEFEEVVEYGYYSRCDSCGNDETTGHAPDCRKKKLLEPI